MPDATPTDRELEALKVLWDRSEATVREICDAMNAAGETLAYTTVLSLMQVMEQKGLITHRQDGKAYIYAPVVERANTFRQLASGFLEKVFDGAVDEYVVHALGSRKLSGAELAKIEKLLEEARGQRSEVRGRRGQGTGDRGQWWMETLIARERKHDCRVVRSVVGGLLFAGDVAALGSACCWVGCFAACPARGANSRDVGWIGAAGIVVCVAGVVGGAFADARS